jgi:hypothetical protein
MSEDAFVRMLLEAAGGNVVDERDVELARAAARWALKPKNNWRRYLDGFICGHDGLEFWVQHTPSRDALTVMVRLTPGTGWNQHGRYPVAHLGHALDLLAAEGLLPARFSTIGRRALEDHAEAMSRAARQLIQGDSPDGQTVWAAALSDAADSARRFAGAELAVMS